LDSSCYDGCVSIPTGFEEWIEPMSQELFAEILTAQKQGQPRVLATVSETRGSTPRGPGAHLLLRPDGSFAGTIGGGCGEAEVWQEAMETMADGRPRIVVVDLTEPVDGEDKICGGVMEVFIERVSG
jgi:xanthine dehydrogenase accessory factor